MMIAVDIETAGLDATKFVCASVKRKGYKKQQYFTDKKALWQYIITLGKKEYERGKVLCVYAHNAAYDFYGYADLHDKHLRSYSHKPFIWSYYVTQPDGKQKEIIKFLDSYALLKMSLADVGELVGLRKLEMPEELKLEDALITPELLKRIKPYVERDTELCLLAIERLQQKLDDCGIHVKRLYTINQVGISYLLNEFRLFAHNAHIFANPALGQVHKTFRAEEVHAAYRGGRVECFKTGIVEGVSYIDCNSLYPYAASKMRFPNLKSERKTWRPLEKYPLADVLAKIGVARVMLHNKSNKLGLLPIRTENGNYYPKEGKYLVGTWTTDELRIALLEGYELLGMEWCVSYEEGPNPFSVIMPKLYRMRKESNNKFDDYFFKMMMNAGLGKFGQTRTGQEIVIDSVEKAKEYLAKNWEIIKGMHTQYMYVQRKKGERKPYYAPIIPTLVNAWARLYMYEQFKKVPLRDLVYTDTDSILFTGEHLSRFSVGREMGQFKIVNVRERAVIYGRKTYLIGEDIKMAGVTLRNVKPEDFEQGFIESKRMITLATTNDISRCGTFVTERRNLKEQLEAHKEMQSLYDEQSLFIDSDVEEIEHFLDSVKTISQQVKS